MSCNNLPILQLLSFFNPPRLYQEWGAHMHDSVVIGVRSVTQWLLVRIPSCSLDVKCWALRQGISIICIKLSIKSTQLQLTPAKAIENWCPIQGDSMSLIHLAPQKMEKAPNFFASKKNIFTKHKSYLTHESKKNENTLVIHV